jgi:4-diphosphocytidyl-2C-methyl-D-erythritol kinase
LGAFRADVSGAGPVVYGLFEGIEEARHAGELIHDRARTWLARPVAGD